MRPFLPLLGLLILAGCQTPSGTSISPQEQGARDALHDSIKQERAEQEYWESQRGMP